MEAFYFEKKLGIISEYDILLLNLCKCLIKIKNIINQHWLFRK